MTNRGQFAQLLAPGLYELLFEYLEQHPEEYSQFLNVESSEKAYEEDQIIAGLALARLKREGEPITYDDPIQGGTKRYLHDSYALGWQVTKEMIADDKYALMRKIPGELMKSCRQAWEQVGANVLNLAFSTVVTADGVSFMNNAHPLLGGGSYSNALTPASDIGVSSIQDILILFENMVNERGLKMQLSPTNLWIAPEQQFITAKVLQSQFDVGTGNNDINTVQGRLEPAVLHFLTSTTRWFVSSKGTNYAKFYWRAKPEVDSMDDFETKGTKHSIFFRISAGASDWRGWAASNA